MAGNERDPSAKKDILGEFLNRKKRETKLRQARQEHGDKAFEMVDKFWDEFDMDDMDQRIQDYQTKSGSGFRVHLSGITFAPGAYQYPFVEVEGKKLALREMVEGEARGGPRGSGRVTEYCLVVADEELEGPELRDRNTSEIAGEAVFATINGGRIKYHDDSINNDSELAEAADREVIGYIEGVQEGMMEMLGHPDPKADAPS